MRGIKRRIEDYNVGDEVVLSIKNFTTYCRHILQKIKSRWVGPFCIIKEVSPVVFGLDPPLGCRIHPILHIRKLKCYIRSKDSLWEIETLPPIQVEDTPEYEIEKILQHQGKNSRCRYQVLWKEYPLIEAT